MRLNSLRERSTSTRTGAGHSPSSVVSRLSGPTEDWRQMLAREQALDPDERLDLVTVATPNATHYEIARAFLAAGFDVLCEKPLTMTLAEGTDLVATARAANRILAVNYGYTGYPMVRQARAMAEAGQLGRIRVVVAEFANGSHADAADEAQSSNPLAV